MGKPLISILIVLLVVIVSAVAAEDSGCSASTAVNSATDLKYKIVGIFSTLIFGVFGVCLPIFVLEIDGFLYASVRQIGAFVIGLTSLLYLLPDATDSLTSSCIGDFPITGLFVARAAAVLTMIESMSFASAFINTSQNGDKIGQKLLTQFLELGTVVHSLIIGVALGASPNLSIIKPLTAAITLHQLFQGICRGGCISKAKFGLKKTLVMVILFSLTTPLGIGIGIGVAELYYKNGGPTSLIVSGFLNAAAAGILLFMTGVLACYKPHTTSHMLKALGFVLIVLISGWSSNTHSGFLHSNTTSLL